MWVCCQSFLLGVFSSLLNLLNLSQQIYTSIYDSSCSKCIFCLMYSSSIAVLYFGLRDWDYLEKKCCVDTSVWVYYIQLQ